DVGDIGMFGHARERLDLPPLLAAVLGHLHQAIVGAHHDESFEEWRLVERGNGTECGRRLVERHRISWPDLAHDRDFRGIELTREVAADRSPRVAAVVAPIYTLACKVKPARRVRADDDRRIPLPAPKSRAGAASAELTAALRATPALRAL